MRKSYLVACEPTLSQRCDICLLFPIYACVAERTETSCCLDSVTSCCQGIDNIYHCCGRNFQLYFFLELINRYLRKFAEKLFNLIFCQKPNMANLHGFPLGNLKGAPYLSPVAIYSLGGEVTLITMGSGGDKQDF